MCEVSPCVLVGLPGRIRPKFKQMFCILLVLVLYAVYVYISLQNITIFPSFSATVILHIVILSASV